MNPSEQNNLNRADLDRSVERFSQQAKKRTKRSAHATGVPIPDCHLICGGSGVAHPQIFLRVFQGENVKFTRCPIPECKSMTFWGGTRWDTPFGITREEIKKFNPDAFIL
jgi:uncharacterized Zn-finger protein